MGRRKSGHARNARAFSRKRNPPVPTTTAERREYTGISILGMVGTIAAVAKESQ